MTNPTAAEIREAFASYRGDWNFLEQGPLTLPIWREIKPSPKPTELAPQLDVLKAQFTLELIGPKTYAIIGRSGDVVVRVATIRT